ncbi:hypothetical protein L1987_28266 [Smallanthus sonchifolius]|uniref:Uncharacterized protein n=1 Tax=Smallanthus sonchifolius TaxID=185202 RepID=A0ACB9ICF4_9ASTR|nr:hypothetical protein L1987_28266 [Smallanthus sonchifolius]
MTTIYLDSSSNDQYNEHQFFSPGDHHHEHQFFSPSDHHHEDQILSPNSQASSYSNSLTCHLFFNPITTHDQDGGFTRESHPSQDEDYSFGSQAYDDHHVENQDERGGGINGGLKFSLWKRETYDHMNDEKQLKWMSSKMRVMLKMKKTKPTKLNTSRSTSKELKLNDHHDHKEPTSSPMEETAYSNPINTTSNNIPIRVCSDCNTTKTPLWRSGPQGPKSLCNACGIRQRKARKALALAAAAAAAVETSRNVSSDKPTSLKVTKILHKDYKKPNNGNVTKFKKRQYSKQRNTSPSPSSSSPARKNCVEEFLVSLSKNLAFHCVFPQDEKEAAILLMALSCGYAHQ